MRDTVYDIRVYLQPAFLICVVVLAVAGAGMSIAMKSLGVILEKELLPLKKSLDLLDDEDLAPYEVILKHKIENEEIVKELDTEDYIQWILEDTDAAADSTVRICMLFITYYRLPDRVPHVPEECYVGSGFQRLASDRVTLEIKNNTGFEKRIPGRHLVFGSTTSNFWRSDEKFPVLYLFKVNGEYVGSREEARIALNKNLFRRSSYFSKVEVVLNQSSVAPRKEQAVAASEKLLSVILPILEAEHWPDWE
jgi:hypothetical protein